MKRELFTAVILSLLSVTTMQAQTPPAQQPPAQVPSLFNLDELFGFDMESLFSGEAFQMLEQELKSSEDIWGQYIDPSFMDSTLMRLNDPHFGESLDALMQHLQIHMNKSDGFGGIIQGMLKNLNMPLNSMPFNLSPDALPEDFNGEGWDIIPNTPQPAPKPQPQQGTQKKGVSVI